MSKNKSEVDSYHILDTDPSDQFDKLTQIAVKICNADVAFVSLFDSDRQWFKSRAGFDLSEMPLSSSVCQYLLQGKRSHLYIPDLSADETFMDHPAYRKYGFRLYAGFPIITPNQIVIGSFCVFGHNAQELDAVQLEFIKTMSEQTMILIESHKLNFELAIEAGRLEKVHNVTQRVAVIGKLGGLYLDLSSKDIFWPSSNNILFNMDMGYSMQLEEFESGKFNFKNEFVPLFEKIRDVCISPSTDSSHFSFEFEVEEKVIQVHGELNTKELYLVFQDKSAHHKLNHSLTLYKGIMEQVEEMVNLGGWSYNLVTDEIFWTKNTYAIYEIPEGEKVTLDIAKRHYSKESYTDMNIDFSELIDKGVAYQNEYLFTSASGKIKWVKSSGHPIYYQGKVVRVVGSFQDITEEKNLRQKLQKSETEAVQAANYYKSLVNNSTFYLCKAGLDRKLTFCNEFYSKELNVYLKEGSDSSIDLFHAVTDDYLEYAVEAFQAVASGSEFKRRVLLKETSREQGVVTNLWDFIGLKNSENEISEILCLGYDISELEENRAQVQLLADYTAFQNKKILEYNTIVSHDIRSHVANAIGLLSLMDIITDKDEYRQYFSLLKKEVKKTDLTIVALDKLTSANAVFESGKEPVSLFNLLEYVFELLGRTKPNLNFTYVNKIPEELIVFSIREYLENVFLNVLSNSLKSISDERELEIEVDALQITNSILQIKIVDNGKGIDLERYGGNLFKIQRPLKDTQEAKGIGLYLAKKQIEALGGRVDIKSENDKGTTIVLEFLNYEN